MPVFVMTECIFCGKATEAKSIEHIVSESLGNTTYLMERGRVCDDCNAKFSKFEGDALSGSVLLMERARYGIRSKKGKNARGTVAGLTIEGDEQFRKQYVTLNGLNDENFELTDRANRIGIVKVKNFSKSSTPNTKLLLKTGLEALFTSQRKIYKKYDFSELRDFLLTRNNKDWPFVSSDIEASNFISIPRFQAKVELLKVQTRLSISEVDERTLVFKFKYGSIPMLVNLLNRDIAWIEPYNNAKGFQVVYPDSFDKRLAKKSKVAEATGYAKEN